jgi:uroporphyrinogen decarboxylase
MQKFSALESRTHKPDWEGLVDNILRKGTPDRVYHMELFQDQEIQDAIAKQFNLTAGLSPDDPHFDKMKYIAVQRFCGFEYVRVRMGAGNWPLRHLIAQDTAELAHADGRGFIEEHRGPITNWEEFEKYPWPDPSIPQELEWYQKNLPEDMCIIASGSHFAEYLTWLMGYETFCYALYDQPDLVEAIVAKLTKIFRVDLERVLQFDRVRIIWGSDDMGFRNGLLMSADDMRRLVLPGHKLMAEMSHAAGRPYLLHSCGKLDDIYDDLIDDVKIDAKHSFEDTIEDVRERKATIGRRIALLGGIAVDFLCRSDEKAIRRRVRETLDVCLPGGGYCLGTGNSVANYIPLENYLAMVDEGMKYS